jgi:hypothetical protein
MASAASSTATPAQHHRRSAVAHFDFIGDSQLVRPSFVVKDGVARIGRSSECRAAGAVCVPARTVRVRAGCVVVPSNYPGGARRARCETVATGRRATRRQVARARCCWGRAPDCRGPRRGTTRCSRSGHSGRGAAPQPATAPSAAALLPSVARPLRPSGVPYSLVVRCRPASPLPQWTAPSCSSMTTCPPVTRPPSRATTPPWLGTPRRAPSPSPTRT